MILPHVCETPIWTLRDVDMTLVGIRGNLVKHVACGDTMVSHCLVKYKSGAFTGTALRGWLGIAATSQLTPGGTPLNLVAIAGRALKVNSGNADTFTISPSEALWWENHPTAVSSTPLTFDIFVFGFILN